MNRNFIIFIDSLRFQEVRFVTKFCKPVYSRYNLTFESTYDINKSQKFNLILARYYVHKMNNDSKFDFIRENWRAEIKFIR